MATRTYRPEVIVQRIMSTIPSGNTSFTIDLPAGLYVISFTATSNVTGTTTSLGFNAYVDSAQTLTGVRGFRNIEPNDTAVSINYTLAAGAENRYFILVNSAYVNAIDTFLPLPFGFEISFIKGTAVEGEKMEVELCAVRIG